MTTDLTRRISVIRGDIYDIPPRPSIVAQLEAVTSGIRAIAAEKARAAQIAAKRNAAINEGRVAKAADHIDFVLGLLRWRASWVRISDIVAELMSARGADVHPGDLGKALARCSGLERREIRGKICWRLPAA